MTFKEYVAYVKDNPRGLWFKARWYGWGFVPAKWQGWVVMCAFLVIILLDALYFSSKIPTSGVPTTLDWAIFVAVLVVAVVILLGICYKKGEKPRFSWGDPRKKKDK